MVTGHARGCACERACPKLECIWTRKYVSLPYPNHNFRLDVISLTMKPTTYLIYQNVSLVHFFLSAVHYYRLMAVNDFSFEDCWNCNYLSSEEMIKNNIKQNTGFQTGLARWREDWGCNTRRRRPRAQRFHISKWRTIIARVLLLPPLWCC